MTLTSIIPSLRRSIPDPLAPGVWPAATIATTTDLVVSGVSMLRLVELSATPAVHVVDDIGVVVVRVHDVGADASRTASVTLDLDLTTLAACWGDLRLIGRASTARSTTFGIRSLDSRRATDASALLPCDLRAGDLLAAPFTGTTPGSTRPTSGWRHAQNEATAGQKTI
ncbi:hypothetical protein ASF62_05835 [Leifsonia sp. Leaf325]|nr:hypothetical protein [Leifsonia sp. Leaf325]KQQ93723.1 hypothetical protein ASF62_05835 [Leifsonia sp. Leaf325]